MNAIQQRLLRWYDDSARDLPWRRTRDPYAIWVSEVMLQQTRVETVIPYYERFLSRFPDPKTLAEADEDTVLSHWSGLGYYRRARLLHAGVQEVVASYGGEVPEDPDARRALPGVGRYTAGAIGSIAFGKCEPIVDGNVTRVLARLFAIGTPVGASATSARLWCEAERLVPAERPGDFNQALMELGATVCTPRQPRCTSCPLRDDCEAHRRGEVDAFPVPRARKTPKTLKLTAVVVTAGRGAERRVWLVKRDQALFGGLWGVPMGEGAPGAALRDAGLRGRLQRPGVGIFEHVLTHRRLQVEVHRASGGRGNPGPRRRPFLARELDEVGVSTLTRKILQLALE